MTRPTACFVHGQALDLFRGENGPHFGGSETQVYLLAKALADSGEFGVRLVADKDVGGAKYPGVSFREAIPSIQRGIPYLSRLVNRYRERQPYKDLENAVLIQTILGGGTIHAWRVARRFGFKFVYRMSCDADIDGSLFTPELARQFHAPLLDADGVIAQSAAQQRRLRSELSIESTVVPSMVEMPPEGPALGGSHVLWAGRAAAVKRPWIMIEAARLLPDIQFVMLMPAEAGVYGAMFWQFVAQEAVRIHNLTIIPGVSYFAMPAYYRDAAVFANTSAVEGVPSVFVQSAAQGTPVISLEVDPDGMLEAGEFGFCAQGDIDEFRAALARYMADPGLVRKHGTAAHDYVMRNNSAEVVGPVFIDFLRQVLERRS